MALKLTQIGELPLYALDGVGRDGSGHARRNVIWSCGQALGRTVVLSESTVRKHGGVLLALGSSGFDRNWRDRLQYVIDIARSHHLSIGWWPNPDLPPSPLIRCSDDLAVLSLDIQNSEHLTSKSVRRIESLVRSTKAEFAADGVLFRALERGGRSAKFVDDVFEIDDKDGVSAFLSLTSGGKHKGFDKASQLVGELAARGVLVRSAPRRSALIRFYKAEAVPFESENGSDVWPGLRFREATSVDGERGLLDYPLYDLKARTNGLITLDPMDPALSVTVRHVPNAGSISSFLTTVTGHRIEIKATNGLPVALKEVHYPQYIGWVYDGSPVRLEAKGWYQYAAPSGKFEFDFAAGSSVGPRVRVGSSNLAFVEAIGSGSAPKGTALLEFKLREGALVPASARRTLAKYVRDHHNNYVDEFFSKIVESGVLEQSGTGGKWDFLDEDSSLLSLGTSYAGYTETAWMSVRTTPSVKRLVFSAQPANLTRYVDGGVSPIGVRSLDFRALESLASDAAVELPVAPVAGLGGIREAELELRFEHGELIRARQRVVDSNRSGAVTASVSSESRTPQGFTLIEAGKANRSRLVMFSTRDPQGGGGADFVLENLNETLEDAFARNEFFLAATRWTSNPIGSDTRLAGSIHIGNWPVVVAGGIGGGGSPKVEPIVVLKYSGGSALREGPASRKALWSLVFDDGYSGWVSPGELNRDPRQTRDRLRALLNRAKAGGGSNTPERLRTHYGELLKRALDPDWNGAILVDVGLDRSQLPDDLAIFGNTDALAEFVSFDFRPVKEQGTEPQPPNLFGVIRYEDPDPGPPQGKKHYLDVKWFNVGFASAAVDYFDAHVFLGLGEVFTHKVADAEDQKVVIEGRYERRADGEHYIFEIASRGRVFRLEKTGLIDTVTIKAARLHSLNGLIRFELDGEIAFNKNLGATFGVERLEFFDFGISGPLTDFSAASIDYGSISLDLDRWDSLEDSWIKSFPIRVRAFRWCAPDLGISLPELGFEPFLTPSGPININFGFEFSVDLGLLGKLVDTSGLIDLRFIFGCLRTGEKDWQHVVGFKIDGAGGKNLSLGLQGIMRLHVAQWALCNVTPHGSPHPVYALEGHKAQIELFGTKIPEDQNVAPSIYLFGQLGGKTYPVGWFFGKPGVMKAGPLTIDYLGLGQRVDIQTAATTTEGIVQQISQAVLDACDQIESTIGTVQARRIMYSASNGWLLALRGSWSGLLDVSAVMRDDPPRYGMYVGLTKYGLKVDALYEKVRDGLGAYKITFVPPTAMQHLSVGAAQLDIPRLGLTAYTDGGWEVRIGEYRGAADFREAIKLQIGPYIGAGALLIARLNCVAQSLVPVPRSTTGYTYDPVTRIQIAFRIGIGREVYYGPLSGGVSLSFFGVLDGAIGTRKALPDASVFDDRVKGTYAHLYGEVGVVGELFGAVDFGIVRAAVYVRIWASIFARIQDYYATELGVDVGVTVSVEVCVGEICIWDDCWGIYISFSFSARFRTSWRLGEDSPVVGELFEPRAGTYLPAGLVRAAPALDFSLPIRWTDAFVPATHFEPGMKVIDVTAYWNVDMTAVQTTAGQSAAFESTLMLEPVDFANVARRLTYWALWTVAADQAQPVSHSKLSRQAWSAARELICGRTLPDEVRLDGTLLDRVLAKLVTFDLALAHSGQDEKRLAYLPHGSGLRLVWPDRTSVDFSTHSPTSLDEEKAFIAALSAARPAMRDVSAAPPSAKSFPAASLVTRDWCWLVLRYSVEAIVTKVLTDETLDGKSVGDVVAATFGTKTIVEEIMGAVSASLLSGGRFHVGGASKSLGEFVGTQGSATGVAVGQQIALSVGGGAAIVLPIVTKTVDAAAQVATCNIAPAVTAPSTEAPIVEGRSRRFTISHATALVLGSQTLVPLPSPMGQAIRRKMESSSQPLTVQFRKLKRDDRGNLVPAGVAVTVVPACSIRFRVRPSQIGSPDNVAELVGCSERERRQLERLLGASGGASWQLGLWVLTDKQKLVPLVSGTAPVVLIRTNQTLEPRPALLRIKTSTPIPSQHVATVTSGSVPAPDLKAFLELLQLAAVVNSPGFYLAGAGIENSIKTEAELVLVVSAVQTGPTLDFTEALNSILTTPLSAMDEGESKEVLIAETVLTADNEQRSIGEQGVVTLEVWRKDPGSEHIASAPLQMTRSGGSTRAEIIQALDRQGIADRGVRSRILDDSLDIGKKVERRYSLLDYRVSGPQALGFENSIPVAPAKVSDYRGQHPELGAQWPTSGAKDSDWMYRVAIPAHRIASPNPYAGTESAGAVYDGIGTPLKVEFGVRDVYGNRLANTLSGADATIANYYVDEIVSPGEWPFAVLKYLPGSANSSKILLEVHVDMPHLGPDANPLPPSVKRGLIDTRLRVRRLCGQLQDAIANRNRVQWSAHTFASPNKGAAVPVNPAPIDGVAFATALHALYVAFDAHLERLARPADNTPGNQTAWNSSNHVPIARADFLLPALPGTNQVLTEEFSFEVALKIERVTGIHPAIARAITTDPVNGPVRVKAVTHVIPAAYEMVGGMDRGQFEAAFGTAFSRRWTLASGVDPISLEPALYAVDTQNLPVAGGDALDFAAPLPASTELVSASVNACVFSKTVGTSPYCRPTPTEVDKRDVDVMLRSFLESIDTVLSAGCLPSALARTAVQAPANLGALTDACEVFLEQRFQLANRLGNHAATLIRGSASSADDLAQTRGDYQDALLASLAADYRTGSFAFGKLSISSGIGYGKLFGELVYDVAQGGKWGGLQTSGLHVHRQSPNSSDYRFALRFALDGPESTGSVWEARNIKLKVSHAQRLARGGSRTDQRNEGWLTLFATREVELCTPNVIMPAPTRQHPAAPGIHNQSAGPMPAAVFPNGSVELDAGRTWKYEVDLSSSEPMNGNDFVHFSITYNLHDAVAAPYLRAPNVDNSLGRRLIEPLIAFEASRTELLDVLSSPNAIDVVHGVTYFSNRVADVANAFVPLKLSTLGATPLYDTFSYRRDISTLGGVRTVTVVLEKTSPHPPNFERVLGVAVRLRDINGREKLLELTEKPRGAYTGTLAPGDTYVAERFSLALKAPKIESARAAAVVVRNALISGMPADDRFIYCSETAEAPERVFADLNQVSPIHFDGKAQPKCVQPMLDTILGILLEDTAVAEGVGIQVRMGFDDRMAELLLPGGKAVVEPYPVVLMPLSLRRQGETGGQFRGRVVAHLVAEATEFIAQQAPKTDGSALTLDLLVSARPEDRNLTTRPVYRAGRLMLTNLGRDPV